MKKINHFSILVCMLSMLLLNSCENAEILKSSENFGDNARIEQRGNCQDCPGNNDCCCYVVLDNGDTGASLSLCGTSNGSAVMDCATLPCWATSFTLKGHTFSLSTFASSQFNFCVFENAEFFLRNTHPTDVANVKVSCTRGQSTPQEYSLQLAANTGRAYLLTDSDCIVSECTP